MANQDKSDRGFGSMDEDKQRDIARKGGESVPDEERSFSKDREKAAEAGRQGGQSGRSGEDRSGGHQDDAERSRRDDDEDIEQGGERGGQGNFAQDRERASEAGRKGGQS